MKSVSFALVAIALLLGMASAGAASTATEAVSLGFKEATGSDPAPLLEPAAVANPVSFNVTYTATPVQELVVAQGLSCIRGSEHPGVPEETEIVTPPVSKTLTAPAGSDSCSLVASAETRGGGVPGTVRIEAEAIRTVESQPVSTPGPKKKKKCKKGRKPKHGKCVKQGAHKHPHGGTR